MTRPTNAGKFDGFAIPKHVHLKPSKGGKSLDVRTLELLEKVLSPVMHTPEARRVMNWIRPRAAKAGRRSEKLIRQAIDNPVQFRLVKKAAPRNVKKDLREECEALCKAIAFHRQGVSNVKGSEDYRMGSCVTCNRWQKLQWGHFIAQERSKVLQFEPDNTSGQCTQCNGPGKGMYAEYRAAIEKRQEGLAVALEARHKALCNHHGVEQFGWTVSLLRAERDRLVGIARNMGINIKGEAA